MVKVTPQSWRGGTQEYLVGSVFRHALLIVLRRLTYTPVLLFLALVFLALIISRFFFRPVKPATSVIDGTGTPHIVWPMLKLMTREPTKVRCKKYRVKLYRAECTYDWAGPYDLVVCITLERALADTATTTTTILHREPYPATSFCIRLLQGESGR